MGAAAGNRRYAFGPHLYESLIPSPESVLSPDTAGPFTTVLYAGQALARPPLEPAEAGSRVVFPSSRVILAADVEHFVAAVRPAGHPLGLYIATRWGRI